MDERVSPGLLTVTEVAATLRVSNMTVYRLINTGALPAIRIGKSFRIREDDLSRYLAEQYTRAALTTIDAVPGDRRPPAVYFLSDYGLADEFVGVVHAVLHRLSPGVPVIDLTHQVPAFDVAAGAETLARVAPHLGAGVVLTVVDPGVATERRGVAVAVAPLAVAPGERRGPGVEPIADRFAGPETRPTWLIGPDNGLLLPAADRLGGAVGAVALTPAFRSTFDGRDLFAPAAAHLVGGGDPSALGPEVRVDTLQPAPEAPADRLLGGGLVTSVASIDHFGNVQLRAGPESIDRLGIDEGGTAEVTVAGSEPVTVRRVAAFDDLAAGELGVLIDSAGRIALVLDRASAADQLGLGLRTGRGAERAAEVEVVLRPPR